jgi:hypothetical protein
VSDDFIVFGTSEEAHSEAAVQDTTKRWVAQEWFKTEEVEMRACID